MVVHCRVGSLEKHGSQKENPEKVHCRVGSLETQEARDRLERLCSLPCR